jgi:hypothetical protein
VDSQVPDIAGAGYRVNRNLRHIIGGIVGIPRVVLVPCPILIRNTEQRFQLVVGKSGQRQVISRSGQVTQLQVQQFLIPAGGERQFIVGNDVSPLLVGRQVPQLYHRYFGETQAPSSCQATMPGNHTVIAIDQDRVGPAEFDNAGGDLRHLGVIVSARIPDVGDQPLKGAVLDV